ncbi:MAG: glycosyltransferase [Paramuribaculum sp.]|nr:glycosyltransferase [Paramuribaculum sp.]
MAKPDNQHKVIVSLTSFPAAIDYACGAVKSLLSGSVLPDKIVLYLTFAQFGNEGLPQKLMELAEANPVFEIRDYPRDIRSYRKLVPALADFPDAVIITVDDDVAYSPDLVRDMLELHQQFPEYILANRAKRIEPGKPYRKWHKFRWYNFLFKRYYPGFDILQTGVGGVLYPPHSLKADLIDETLFTKYAPTADDIWFWAAATAKGTKLMPVPFGKNKPKGLGKPKSLSLKSVNFKSGTDRNSETLHKIINDYPDIKKRLFNGK